MCIGQSTPISQRKDPRLRRGRGGGGVQRQTGPRQDPTPTGQLPGLRKATDALNLFPRLKMGFRASGGGDERCGEAQRPVTLMTGVQRSHETLSSKCKPD